MEKSGEPGGELVDESGETSSRGGGGGEGRERKKGKKEKKRKEHTREERSWSANESVDLKTRRMRAEPEGGELEWSSSSRANDRVNERVNERKKLRASG